MISYGRRYNFNLADVKILLNFFINYIAINSNLKSSAAFTIKVLILYEGKCE